MRPDGAVNSWALRPLIDGEVSFQSRALAWLRDRHGVEVGWPGPHALDVEWLPATVRDRQQTRMFDVTALVVLAASAVLSVLSQEEVFAGLADRMLHTAIVGTLVAGLGLLLFGWSVRRAAAAPVAVYIDAGTRGPVAADVVERMRVAAPQREIFLVAERGFTSDALQAATRLGVRCIRAQGARFREA